MTVIRQAAVLVGGLGTRLGALTATMPKPLLPVDGRPFLAWVLRELCRLGLDEILLLAGHKAQIVADALPTLRRHLPRQVALRLLTEPPGSGTGGALFHARSALDARFLLCNGDTLLDAPLAPLVGAAARDGTDVAGRLLLCRVPDASRYGLVETDGDAICRLAERGPASGGLVSSGIAILSRDLPGLSAACSLERDILPPIVEGLRATVSEGEFLDIGIPVDLARAEAWVQRLRRPALFLDRDGVLNVDHGHVGSIDRLDWIRFAAEAVALANGLGWLVFVVTNQSGIARGLYTESDMAHVHAHMQRTLLAQGAGIDDWRHCPHHPEGIVAAFATACDCRKPAPGMLRALLADWEVRGPSVLVGDRDTDLQAAAAAGIAGCLFDGQDLRATVRAALA